MDSLSKEARSILMSKIRSKDTGPEKVVRSYLHRAGLRFRLHNSALPGSPDIVFPSRKALIFVHGCFWHGCPFCKKGAARPSSNKTFWQEKLETNRSRDKKNLRLLKKLGWKVLVLWKCQIAVTSKILRRLKFFFPDHTFQAIYH